MPTQIAGFSLTNNLHFKPISARAAKQVVDIGIWCNLGTNRTARQDKIAFVISKAILIVGATATIPIAAIEALAMTAIGGVGLLFCSITRYKVNFLQNQTSKALSYALHTLAIMIASITAICWKKPVSFYTVPTLVDHGMHIGSSAIIQTTIGQFFDRRRGLTEQQTSTASNNRLLSLLIEGAPDLLGDTLRSILTDLKNPAFRTASAAFLIQEGLQFTRRYFPNQTNGLNHVVQTNNNTININLNGSSTTQYQNHLHSLVKKAYLEICSNDTFAAAFKDPDANIQPAAEAQSGRDALAGVEAHVFPLLSKWVQLKELEEEIRCPENFEVSYLSQFNGRRASLIQAKQNYEELNGQQKTILKGRLLGLEYTENNEASQNAIQTVFLQISQLADPLLQGNLVMRMALNVHNGGAQANTGNLFQAAMLEAQAEWDAQHPS